MDRDRSILIQVGAKIAAELTDKTVPVDQRTSEFGMLFHDVVDMLIERVYGDANTPVSDEATLKQAFPGATEIQFTVKVRNDQQGPLPQWLLDACKRDGITEVYDNRGDLAANPKRPWFKAVNDKEKAYWPPKGA